MKTEPSVRGNVNANFAGKALAGIFSMAFVPPLFEAMKNK